MRLMASARRMLGRRFDYPLLRAHDNFGQQKRTSHMDRQGQLPSSNADLPFGATTYSDRNAKGPYM